jgi:hypothetical protein
MSVITGLTLEDALFVEDKEYLMLIIAKSVFSRRRIGMVAVKSLIWEVLGRIYFMRGRSMDLKNDLYIIIVIIIVINIIIIYIYVI